MPATVLDLACRSTRLVRRDSSVCHPARRSRRLALPGRRHNPRERTMSELTHFIKNGGFMMYPLIICSVALLVVILERAVSFRRAAVDGDALLEQVKSVC